VSALVLASAVRRNGPCPCASGRKFKLCCEKRAPGGETEKTLPAPAISEISIERAFVGFGADMADHLANSDPGERVVHAGEVLVQMDVAWASGQRTLLVSVDSGGGQLEAGVLLHDAWQTWRIAGGHVVIFVSGIAASTMSWSILAADLVVAAPGSRIVVHGPIGGLPEVATDWKRAILRTSTRAPSALVERWVTTPSHPDGTGGVYLTPQRALELGFVDHIGGYDRARELALELASGGERSQDAVNELQAALRGEFSKELASLHAAAMKLRQRLVVLWDTRTEVGAAAVAGIQEARARLAAAVGQERLQERLEAR